jgi:hypothetical protein
MLMVVNMEMWRHAHHHWNMIIDVRCHAVYVRFFEGCVSFCEYIGMGITCILGNNMTRGHMSQTSKSCRSCMTASSLFLLNI